jgi:hypothetical protein
MTAARGKEIIVPRRTLVALVVVLVAALAASAIGTYAYRIGMAEGLVQAGKLDGPGAVLPYPYPGPFWYHGPFGFGGFFVPLLFILVLFAAFRRPYWARGGGYGPCGSGIPARFEEWHRRAHESAPQAGPSA